MCNRFRTCSVAMLALALSVPVAAPASAQEGDCQTTLWSLPVETAELPEGWEFAQVEPSAFGFWRFELDGPDDVSVSGMLRCMDAVDGFRAAVSRTTDDRPGRPVAVATIGDHSWATMETIEHETLDPRVRVLINWSHGAIVGELSESGDMDDVADWEDLQKLALAIDGQLSVDAMGRPGEYSDPSAVPAIVVPDVTGLTLAEVALVADAEGLALSTTTLPTNELTPGVVVSQAPSPNDLAAPGSTLYVSVVVPLPAVVTPAPGAVATPAPEPIVALAPEPDSQPEFARKAIHTSSDDAAAVYGLTSGRYRMEWRTADCESVDILVSQVDGDFSYPKPSKSSYATATINDLPEGTYRIEQLDPACADWSVRIDWMTN